jgi:hypothetical protein
MHAPKFWLILLVLVLVPGGGSVLSWCSQIAESEDVRFSKGLTDSCSAELKMFCDDVGFGKGEAMACLEKHLHETEFGASCM